MISSLLEPLWIIGAHPQASFLGVESTPASIRRLHYAATSLVFGYRLSIRRIVDAEWKASTLLSPGSHPKAPPAGQIIASAAIGHFTWSNRPAFLDRPRPMPYPCPASSPCPSSPILTTLSKTLLSFLLHLLQAVRRAMLTWNLSTALRRTLRKCPSCLTFMSTMLTFAQ